ncbi:MAG TPA: glucuronate isomerase [Clostridia bacterium]|nr:glucuronate isomerase [Clostridia bacterium]
MKTKYIYSKAGQLLYNEIAKNLPIVDYHCHLNPKEIYEDKLFDNIGVMWLGADHYKWRLMRAFGIDEEYITGKADWKDKFFPYCMTIENSPGNPLYHWSSIELKKYFDTDMAISADNAQAIWDKANEVIKEKQLSPRKLIASSNVIYIATTDDITDDLKYHKLIKADKSFKTVVAPTFRTDNVLLLNRPDYPMYIEILKKISQTDITDLNSLCTAISKRLDYFVSAGCRLSDVGIQYSACPEFDYDIANNTFKLALLNKKIEQNDFEKFLGYMFVYLSSEYKKRGITQQIHTGVYRNSNTRLFNAVGPDCGCDISSNPMDGTSFVRILNEMDKQDKLAKTIVYILNPASYYQALTACGSFRDVIFGAAWWHMDHYEGIVENIKTIASLSCLGSSLGMLTDSRSFLSYARHDYYRRILCSVIGSWVDSDEYPIELAKKLIYNLCVGNAKDRFVS